MAIPGIDVDPRSLVYKRVVAQYKTDPSIGRRVDWRCWDGADKDNAPVANDRPLVVLIPQFDSNERFAVDAWRTTLGIEVRIYLPNDSDATNYFDLWGAIERAIYPKGARDKQLAFEQQLRDAGAETGEITFPRPAQVVAADGPGGQPAVLYATGAMSIACIRPINS